VRALVTGGAGFLGSHVCERLLACDVSVVCMDNFLTSGPDNVYHLLDHRSFRLLECDLTSFVHVPGEVDLVCHLASAASPAPACSSF
jgi:dTDP-glucose 4,6-dehydratase